jgi:hypothetical protein
VRPAAQEAAAVLGVLVALVRLDKAIMVAVHLTLAAAAAALGRLDKLVFKTSPVMVEMAQPLVFLVHQSHTQAAAVVVPHRHMVAAVRAAAVTVLMAMMSHQETHLLELLTQVAAVVELFQQQAQLQQQVVLALLSFAI